MLTFLTNLIATIAVETIANKYYFENNDFAPSTRRVFIANFISNPIAQVVYRTFFINLWLVEIFVVFFESFCYASKKVTYPKAFLVSLFLNSSSVLFGILLYSLIIF